MSDSGIYAMRDAAKILTEDMREWYIAKITEHPLLAGTLTPLDVIDAYCKDRGIE